MNQQQPPDELEQAAHMTDAEVVRRDFDSRNALMTAISATIFTLFGAGMFIYSLVSGHAPHLSWLVAAIQTTVSAAAAWIAMQLTRAKPGGRAIHPAALHVSRNLTDWIVAYLLFEFTGFSYIGGREGAVVWGSLLPWMIAGLRLTFVRRIAFHAALYAITVAFLYARGAASARRDYTGPAVTHGVVIILGSLNSRRIRSRSIREWSERRTSAREQLRMREELRYARELQLAMLPEGPPQLEWADIAGTSIPATEVGGDYFDYIDADGRLAVICGDVAGHGLAAGITLSALRGAITLLRHSFENPAGVLERLHEVVSESSRRRILVTLTAALFDPKRRVTTIASAGHPPVLVRRAAGNVESIELFGPPLGVRRTEPVPQREVPFAKGDVFLLHSDGIYEAINTAGDSYGLDRLAAILAKSDGSAIDIRDSVLRDVEQFRGSAPQNDDVTVVVVRIR